MFPGQPVANPQEVGIPPLVRRSDWNGLFAPMAEVSVTFGHRSQTPPPFVETAVETNSDQQFNVPEFPSWLSITRRVQTPFGSRPRSFDNASCGLKVPTNGGEPDPIEVSALSSKVVRLPSVQEVP